MKKILALSLAVVFLFGFTGFDWGDESTQKVEAKKPSAPPPTFPNADAITALNNLLGSGTPAERQAKLNTLVRLSQVLPTITPAAAAAPAPAVTEPVTQTSKKTKKSVW
jgi:hypothetical protein